LNDENPLDEWERRMNAHYDAKRREGDPIMYALIFGPPLGFIIAVILILTDNGI
jgi:hypothetical protein